MSLSRRLAALLASVLALAFGGGLVVHALASRLALQAQLEARGRDAAAVLAVALSQTPTGADLAAWRAVATAHFAAGRIVRLRLLSADGRVLVDLQRPPAVPGAPAWFVHALPFEASPGQAVLGQGAGPRGLVQVEIEPTWAHDTLWASSARAAAWAAALALVSAALVAWAARRWRKLLLTTDAQARALAEGRFAEAADSRDAEPGGPGAHLNANVQALREAFAAQAEQVAQMQRQAQLDMVTGLSLRRHFLGLLQQRLVEPGGPGIALLLVRVLQLEVLNLRLGHEATDHLLGAVADVLQTYVDRVPGTFAGRLNGSDFALCLPVPGVAAETAASLLTALAAAPALRSGGAEVVVGGVDGVNDCGAGAVLAEADAALARAEAGGWGNPEPVVSMHAQLAEDLLGARAWREQLSSALTEGRIRLAALRVLDAHGRELYLECPLRVQLQPGGDYQTAERWLALARRSRLMPQVDLAAVELALQATERDGRARAVHASPLSLATPGFVADVVACLLASPVAARQLAIECVDGLRPVLNAAPLAAAVAAWAPLGVRVGVEHAAGAVQHLPALQAAGVHYVKVDARHLQGLAHDSAVQGYAQGLVDLIHGLGLSVVATGLIDLTDADAVWRWGFDAACGPALELRAEAGATV